MNILGNIVAWLNNNQGILAAIGVLIAVFGPLAGWLFFKKRKKDKSHLQRVNNKGDRSKVLQAGRDIIIGDKRQSKTIQKKKDRLQTSLKLAKSKTDRMEIRGVLWEWRWRAGTNRQDEDDILDLKPLCPKHKYKLEYQVKTDDILGEWPVALYCRECNLYTAFDESYGSTNEFEDRIKRLIVAKFRRKNN